MAKARFEARERAAQGVLRIDLHEVSDIGEREEKIAEFVFQFLRWAEASALFPLVLMNPRRASTSVSFSRSALLTFFEGAMHVVPLEAHLGDLLEHARGFLEGR